MNSPRRKKASTTKIQTPEVFTTEVFMELIVTMMTPVRTCLVRVTLIYT